MIHCHNSKGNKTSMLFSVPRHWAANLIVLTCMTSSFLLSVELAFAGVIRGVVRSQESKEVIVGANVLVEEIRIGCVSDTAGRFSISGISAGTYTIEATMLGFKKKDMKRVQLSEDSSVIFLEISLREAPVDMAEIVIQGRANKELESAARLTEKESNSIMNVIAAQTIERSTDRTAADVLQRVSGLSLVRNQGEGRYVIMRGLEQRYNNTLVDGIKIPSPESKDRFIPLDIFPSPLFKRIEVTKALTPELAGDAIGGTTNLMFRDAPEDFLLSLSASSGGTSGVQSSAFSTIDRNTINDLDPDRLHGSVSDGDPTKQLKPRYNPTSADFTISNLRFTNKKPPLDGLYSFVVGNRFFDNRLGFIAAGSYQNTYNRVPTDFYSVTSTINKVYDSHVIPFLSTHSDQTYYTNRSRGGATAKLDCIFTEDHQISANYVYVRQEELQVRQSLQTTIDGTRGAADLTYGHRSALRTENISSLTVVGSHFVESPVFLRWTFNISDAVQDRPDEAEYTVLQNYDPYGKLQPFQGLGAITHVWRKNDDHQYLGKLDGIVHLTEDGTQTLQVGAVMQKLNRVNYQNDYKLNPFMVNGQTQPFTTIDNAVTQVFGFGSTSGTSVYGYQNYKAEEYLVSSFAEYTIVVGDLQVLGGVRWEQARDSYFTMAGPSVGLSEAKVTTVDFLPGIHFRYQFTPEHIGRLSVTRTMSRPSYFDLVPASDRSDNSQSQGNPDLRPAHSTNFDLRYEYYPNARDVYSLGMYYKRITDPIEDQFGSVGVVFVTTKGNGNPADVYGLEAVVSRQFGDFGIAANYSYVISEITNTKLVPTLDAHRNPITSPVPSYQQKRPLQSQSPQIANLTVSYRNDEWGTDANMSYNYTGRRLVAAAQLDGYDTYQDGVGEVDCSVEQELFANLKIELKLINLLNAPVVTEIPAGIYLVHTPLVIERDYNSLRGSLGVSFKL